MHLKRVAFLLSLVILTGLVFLSVGPGGLSGDSGVAQAAGDPVIAAAGDIACDPSSSSFNGGNGTSGACRQRYTSDLLVNKGFAAILPLGDIQYYCGGYEAFLRSYDLSWGRVKSITRPAVGNHEYLTSGGTGCTSANEGAAGYFKYFGSAAGHPSEGYYSYNIGAWHLIALNSNCSSAGGCGSTSPQGTWLKADLQANNNLCTLAYWHIPLFSSGGRANSNTRSLWQILDDHDVELVLNGHDHIYERFAPQKSDGTLDTARGIRQFIVGTGGSNHTSLASIAANSQVRNTDTFGILKLTLHPTSYDWQFVPEAGKTFSDSGTAQCFGGGQPGISNTASPTPRPLPTRTNTPQTTQVDPQPSTGYSFPPIADAYVNEANPTTNYGTSTQLRVDGSPLLRSYLRFDVRNLAGRVTRATLRVYATSALSAGYSARPVTNNTWSETSINYNNAPAFGTSIGSSGAVSAGTWTNVDVTSLITGNGIYSLALTSSSSTALSLSSREAGSANQPQLIVETQIQTATPNPTSTRTATRTPTTAATATTIAVTPTATKTSSPSSTAIPTDTYTATPADTDTPRATATLNEPSETPPSTETSIPTTIDPADTPTETASPTQVQAYTETPAPSETPMPVATDTKSPFLTDTPSQSTDTPIPPETDTETSAPADTATSSPADTATDTPLPSATDTESVNSQLTDTPEPPATATPSQTDLPASTATDTALSPPSETSVPTATRTTMLIPTSTSVPTITPSRTATLTRTPTRTPAARTFTFTAAADAYVNESSPTTNYGTATQLRADGSPLVRSYLRFNVQNLTGRITRVTLRIYANSASSGGYSIRQVTNTWSESSITYNNAPSFGSAAASSGSFSAGQWTTVDLTSLITGNGTYNLALTTASSTAFSLASRESGANAPQLIIETTP